MVVCSDYIQNMKLFAFTDWHSSCILLRIDSRSYFVSSFFSCFCLFPDNVLIIQCLSSVLFSLLVFQLNTTSSIQLPPLFFVLISIYLSIYLSVCLSVCLWLSVCLSISLSVYLSLFCFACYSECEVSSRNTRISDSETLIWVRQEVMRVG